MCRFIKGHKKDCLKRNNNNLCLSYNKLHVDKWEIKRVPGLCKLKKKEIVSFI